MNDNGSAVVTTYLPQRQKAIWQDHAESLDMSQSEFVKTMVQAGRRWFDADESETPGTPISEPDPRGQTTEDTNSDGFEPAVLEALDDNDSLGWEGLLEVVTDDVESELAEAIERLQERNQITHNPREEGYVLVEE